MNKNLLTEEEIKQCFKVIDSKKKRRNPDMEEISLLFDKLWAFTKLEAHLRAIDEEIYSRYRIFMIGCDNELPTKRGRKNYVMS